MDLDGLLCLLVSPSLHSTIDTHLSTWGLFHTSAERNADALRAGDVPGLLPVPDAGVGVCLLCSFQSIWSTCVDSQRSTPLIVAYSLLADHQNIQRSNPRQFLPASSLGISHLRVSERARPNPSLVQCSSGYGCHSTCNSEAKFRALRVGRSALWPSLVLYPNPWIRCRLRLCDLPPLGSQSHEHKLAITSQESTCSLRNLSRHACDFSCLQRFAGRTGKILELHRFFPLKYYPAEKDWNTWRVYFIEVPRSESWRHIPGITLSLFIKCLIPLTYLGIFVRYRRNLYHSGETAARIVLVSIVGLFLFLAIAFAPSWLRLCSVSPPALVCFVWLLDSPSIFARTTLRFFWVGALVLAVLGPLRVQNHWRAFLEVPAGRLAILNPIMYDKYQWLSSHTQPGEVFYSPDTEIYFPFHLQNPAEVPFLTRNDYTRPEQISNLVLALEKYHFRFIWWSSELDARSEAEASGDHLGPLRAYLGEHYELVKTFGASDQLWARK